MRTVVISDTVQEKIANLRKYLLSELKLSREAATARTYRIDVFCSHLVILPIILRVALNDGRNLAIDVQYLKKHGFLHTKFLKMASLSAICPILPC